MNFVNKYLDETIQIVKKLNTTEISKVIKLIKNIKRSKGRIFFIGAGGSAGNCSHAVNDFRKIVGIECYAPTDNVSELTARTNDEGWDTVFEEWLKISKLSNKDMIFVFSVGGGDLKKNISPNIVKAVKYAKTKGAKICGVVGRDGGYTYKNSSACIKIPVVNSAHITPHSEGFQAVVWHLLVSHPDLKFKQTKWESTKKN